MPERNIQCSDLNHGPWENLPLTIGGMRCERCHITPLGAWKEARGEVDSLRARIAELEQGITMHHCKPPLGNPTREEAIARIARLESELNTTRDHVVYSKQKYQSQYSEAARLQEQLALAESERLTDDALELVVMEYCTQLFRNTSRSMSSYMKELADMLRTARGAKEKG